jgi:hypothetical protein
MALYKTDKEEAGGKPTIPMNCSGPFGTTPTGLYERLVCYSYICNPSVGVQGGFMCLGARILIFRNYRICSSSRTQPDEVLFRSFVASVEYSWVQN